MFNEFLLSCKLKVIFSSSCRLRSFFPFKDKIPLLMRSGVVYRCSCNACYYGKTKRHFKVRIAEHIGISHLTGKPRKTRMSTAISDHLLECSCPPTYSDFDVVCREKNNCKLCMKESILIQRDKPSLNKNIKSVPLELF